MEQQVWCVESRVHDDVEILVPAIIAFVARKYYY
jgi:hypothetical protein